jgi:hypothetical protein
MAAATRAGGLIALRLVATAAKTGVASCLFGLIILPALAFAGLAAFHRVLQPPTEDLAYARRIGRLRDHYLDHAPELAGYLPNPAERLPTPGLGIGRWPPEPPMRGGPVRLGAVGAAPDWLICAAGAYSEPRTAVRRYLDEAEGSDPAGAARHYIW